MAVNTPEFKLEATKLTFAMLLATLPISVASAATVVTSELIEATDVRLVEIAARVFTFEIDPATVPMSEPSAATVLILEAFPATEVTFDDIPATVVTFALIAARPDIASVATVPSSISASAAISAVIMQYLIHPLSLAQPRERLTLR